MPEIPEHLASKGIDTIVGLDFETYYSQDHSLTKLSTTEYIRSPEFVAQGCSFRSFGRQNHHGETKWVTDFEGIKTEISLYDWSRTALLCHNTYFDGAILNYHFGIEPTYYLDTMSMARGLFPQNMSVSLDKVGQNLGLGRKIQGTLESLKGIKYPSPEQLEKLGIYANQDVDLMCDIFWYLIGIFPTFELDLINITIRMFAAPKLIGDVDIASKELQEQIEKKDRLLEQLRLRHKKDYIWEVEKMLGSPSTFKTLLESEGVKVPIKYSEKQEKWIPALAKNDIEFQELLEHPEENVRLLVEARLSVKSNIGQKRAERFISHSRNGNLPIMLNMYGAHTHRWSGGDKFNPQNFPRGSALRSAIKAPAGYKLLVIDSAQVECRTLAYLAQQTDLLDAFRSDDKDPYCEMASIIYGRTITKADEVERFVGKVAVLGLGFGMGAAKFQYTLASGMMGKAIDIDISEANRIKLLYRHANTQIVQFWYQLEELLTHMVMGGEPISRYGLEFHPNYVVMPNGLCLHYPDLQGEFDEYRGKMSNFTYRNRHGRTNIYGGKFAENLTQSYARSVVAHQILRISERYEPVLAVHDEGVFLIPDSDVNEAEAYALSCFQEAPEWAIGLPLTGEFKVADYYAKG